MYVSHLSDLNYAVSWVQYVKPFYGITTIRSSDMLTCGATGDYNGLNAL